MTYLYVTPFFPEHGRHYGSYGYDFVQALKRNSDYDVKVFVPGKGIDYDFNGCHVYRFPTINLPSAIFPFLFAKYNINSFLRAVEKAGIDLGSVAVCHGNTAHCAIYPLALKNQNPQCLTLLHHHDLDGFGLRLGALRNVWLHKLINFFIVRRLFNKMDGHVFISKASENSTRVFPDTSWSVYDDYRRLGRGLSMFKPAQIKNPIILWTGVDTARFNREIRTTRDVGFTIGCVGNFVEVKDHLSLIQAVKMLKKDITTLRLELLGTNGVGNYYADAKRFVVANNMGSYVRFLDNVAQDAMPEFYRRWDLMVLPSYFEGFGCVYLESWACGTPFIACKGQGIEDVLENDEKDKWLCHPKEPRDIAEKILNYYRNRYAQKLTGHVSIDELLVPFCKRLKELKGELNNERSIT